MTFLLFQAQFDAGELITQRELVSQKVTEDLTERAAQFGVILDDISIVSICFNSCFGEACKVNLLNSNLVLFSADASYVRSRVHPSCRVEASSPAGGRESSFPGRKGAYYWK